MRNTGRSAWTAAAHVGLRHQTGDNFDPPEGDSTVLRLAAGERVEPGGVRVWRVEGVAPALPGDYRGVWSMHLNGFFGDPLWIHVVVEEEAAP